MRSALQRIRSEDQGVLSFEWVLLITLIVIGVVGGLSAVRDGVIDELGDVADAVLHIDQSWEVAPSPYDPPGTDFGSYTDPYANTPPETGIVSRGRPGASPPSSGEGLQWPLGP
ncbi:MAG: hypothetical protein JXB62_10300 [Pirellulales bacterium]|nr:hypothetical protein [Pirellulales bacterium]